MKIAVKSLNGEQVREIELPDAVFSYPYKPELIHSIVVAVRAAQRAGTHKTKGRSEVRGSGRKLYRQKGTGRARAGTLRTPIRRSGGVAHGPQPRSYETKVSRREKRNALKSALSRKLEEQRLVVVEGLDLDSHRTALLAKAIDGLGVEGRVLLVDRQNNDNLNLAARNNPRLKTVDALAVNVYDVVDRSFVVASEAAISRLGEVLAR